MSQFTAQDFTRFVKEFAQKRLESEIASSCTPNELSSLEKFFTEFSACRHACGQSAEAINIFDICMLGRDERRNCSVLAWLLAEKGSHGLGSAFLRKVLNLYPPALIFSRGAFGNYCIRTEVCPNADHTDRMDIVCESSTMLVYIEVKIDSQEHTAQTDRYYKRLLHNAAGRQCALIFISTGSAPGNAQARQISWREIGAIASGLAEEAPSDFVGQLLRQYASFVSSF